MGVKAVLIDATDTLLKEDGKRIKGGKRLINSLLEEGLAVYVVSNDKLDEDQKNAVLVDEDYILCGEDFGTKGKGGLIKEVMRREGLATNELIYIGNSDLDMREASNMKVAFITADWTASHTGYGIHCSDPDDVLQTVVDFFMKDHLWYATVDEDDPIDNPVHYRGLMTSDDAAKLGLKRLLKENKEGDDIQGVNLTDYLILHLFASAYLEGIHLMRGSKDQATVWCVFPGHKGEYNESLLKVVEWTTRTLRATERRDLIQRHTQATKKAYARYKGENVGIDNDFDSILINPADKNGIKNRTVVVLDDFSTEAHGFETARNLLLAAGAERVIGISVGKYGRRYPIRFPMPGYSLPICKAGKVDLKQLGMSLATVNFDQDALQYYK